MPNKPELLKNNLDQILERIAAASEKAGRQSDAVKLIAVCKYVDAETTGMLIDAGCRAVGESRPQVLWDKNESLAGHDVQWHMIGHLQRNKVRRTLAAANWIHSIDSQRLLKSIVETANEMGKTTDCLLEVNISGESAKHGFSETELEPVLALVAGQSNVQIRGLMGMASLSGSAADNQNEFAELREIRDRLQAKVGNAFELNELSMGMSGDFEAAIEEGSTMVRVGALLFKGI